MEKQVMEMLQQMNKTMLEMQKAQNEMQITQMEMQQDIQGINGTLKNLGQMFEHTVKIQQEEDEKLAKVVRYHSHKIAEHDTEIFNLINPQ